MGLGICNSVLIRKNKEGNSEFDASSPDEIAIVKYFEEIGYSFEIRDDNRIRF